MTDLAGRLARLTPEQRALLDAKLRAQSAELNRLNRVPKRERANRVPLSVDQERIWLIHQFDPADPVYNVHFGARLAGELSIDALERAVNAFAARHEALRTTFETDGLRPVQVIHDELPIKIRHAVARDLADAHRLAGEEASVPIDIVHGPPMRVTLFRLSEREHVMVVVVDHLVWDRGVTGMFEGDLVRLYNAFATGAEPGFPPLEIQYADYAEWQPLWLREELHRRQIPYWTDRLAGASMVLELPPDHPRPPVQTFNGARYRFRMSRELTLGLKALARREGVTVNVTLLAAWYALLHRYTGEEDLIVGTTSSTRSRPELEPIAGYFLTMLPLRTTVTPEQTFRELIAATRATMVGAFAHHDTPFGALLDELDIERDPSRNPVYQVSFIFVDFNEPAVPMHGLEVEQLTFDNHTAKDDCMLCVWDEEAVADHFFGLFEYNTDLFTEETIARMWRHLERLLEQVAVDPEPRLRELSLAGPDEVELVLRDWNRTTVDGLTAVGVEELVRRQALSTPDAIAVVCGEESLTYAELLDRALRLAGHLRERGARPETVVAVCLDRSPELLVALLGVLLSGAAYLPLDPAHPAERRAAMTADAGALLVVTEETMRATAEPLDELPVVPPDFLAYVIYTSGSTGKPKGVEVTRGGLVNLVRSLAGEIALKPDDALVAVTSVSFDIAGFELYAPLITGGRVVLARTAEIRDGRRLAALLDDAGATVMQATPSAWQLLLEAGWRNDRGLRVITGGEPLPPSLAAELVTSRTWNVYGPTETTIWSTAKPMDTGTERISIGRPLANTEVYVLGEDLEPVPIGMPGELYLGGAGVARGYRGRPELTAGRFVPDPFSGRAGARLYRTGDQVRFAADGNLYFLGRDDGQVKLRGYRIELGEVETRLAAHPRVRQAVAVIREDRPGDRRLVAYTRGEATPEELRAHLATFLPEYMIPSAFVPVTEFALTTSGKIDRKALPAPPARRTGDYTPPRDPVELEVAQVWEEVLGVRPVGLRDRFFDLGGHSLLVLRLMAEIERRFGQELPMAAIFQGATVERFAHMLREGYRPQEREHLVEIKAGGAGTPLFFAHPAGSEVVCYMPFAKLLAGRPLYAIAAPAQPDAGFADFEERAAAYADLMREVQPNGPYLLAGWCYGGINAFAIARSLEARGEQVSLLLLDAYGPEEMADDEDPGRAAIVEGLALNLQWDRTDDLKSLDELAALTDDEQLDYLLMLARRGDYLPQDAGREQMNAFLGLWTANLRLSWRYRPTPMRGPITLIQAREEDPALFTSWRPLAAGGFDVRLVGGNHYTMMREPRVAEVAAAVDACLPGVADA
ncbi:amino acid adenylation domain-containing protein [Amycolatopsis sp. YIM 10]|uniref:non-ribosomal peptide synthetase n=1 Tax=Amycolatopsis sp. YIM 10 TaxID=2653857 RepID=UPI001290541C|nr:non-ribosomal peptide synthetase [Amycolatopsis sp. YIM 10]QFU88623.1 Linear gramicidin synthase subunit B [Amycolatopsis sp. YIM 10]